MSDCGWSSGHPSVKQVLFAIRKFAQTSPTSTLGVCPAGLKAPFLVAVCRDGPFVFSYYELCLVVLSELRSRCYIDNGGWWGQAPVASLQWSSYVLLCVHTLCVRAFYLEISLNVSHPPIVANRFDILHLMKAFNQANLQWPIRF